MPAINSSNPLTSGLVFLAPFQENILPYPDDVGGRSVVATDATIQMTAPGPALAITSLTTSMAQSSTNPISGGAPYTMAVMVYRTTLGTSIQNGLSWSRADAEYVELGFNSTPSFSRIRGGGVIVDITGPACGINTWHKLALVVGSNTSRSLYTNGTLTAGSATSVIVGGSAFTPLTMGSLQRAGNTSDGLLAGGYVKHVALWNRALTQAELDTFFNDPTALTVGPAIAFAGPVPAQVSTAASAQTDLLLAGYFTNGTAPFTYAVTAGALPSGWSLASGTGIVTRGASTAGSYAFTVTATDAVSGTASTNSIAVTIGAALTFSTQPANVTVAVGATASFSYVSAGGAAPVTQQWKRNGTNIATTAGYTTAATTVTGGTANNGDLYSVVLTDANGATVTSSNATLTVTSGAATALTTSGPASGAFGVASTAITIGANGSMSINHNLSAVASDGGAVNFSGTVISGGVASVTATYTPVSVGAKTVTFSDANGLTSAVFSYTAVAGVPRILLTANPADQFRAEGSNVLLSSKTGTLWISNPTTGALVLTQAFSTDASGLAGTLQNASLALSTAYRINFKFSTGEYGVIERTSEAS